MKINGIHRTPPNNNSGVKRAGSSPNQTPAAKVAVSKEARLLAEARAPAVSDAAKIARLAQAIAHGDFMVDAERIADRMLGEER